jgi:hypothetical protein
MPEKHQGDDDEAEKEEESASSRSMRGTSLSLRAARVGRSSGAREGSSSVLERKAVTGSAFDKRNEHRGVRGLPMHYQ